MSSNLSIDGSEIFYEVVGKGHPTVFVHGACENSKFWKFQADFFAKQGFRVLLLDLPGHGNSSNLSVEMPSIETYADIVHELVLALHLVRPTLCGHSMGGAIALHYALKWQGDLGSIILASTGAKLGVSSRILEGLRTDYGETVKEVLSPWNFGRMADAHLKEWVEQEILKVSQNVALADYLACNSFDVRSKLTDVKLPSLIIVGDQDKLTPVMWSTFMHERIPYSTLKIISGIGHLAMLESPAEFNEATYKFFQETKQMS